MDRLESMFKETMKFFDPKDEDKIIQGYDEMGKAMQDICKKHPAIKVYSFVMRNVLVLFQSFVI